MHEFVRNITKSYTGRAVITFRRPAPELKRSFKGSAGDIKINSSDEDENKTEYSEYKDIEGVKFPTLINLWDIGNGNHKIKAHFRINNHSDKSVEITSVSGECACISHITFDRIIPPQKSAEIYFDLDPEIYLKDGVIDSTLRLTLNGNSTETIGIIGVIEHNNSLTMDPVRIFDKVSKETSDRPIHHQLNFFTNSTTRLPIEIRYVGVPLDFCDIEVPESFPEIKIGKTSSILSLNISIYPQKLKPGLNAGTITFVVDYAGHKRIFELPFTLIKN